MRFKILFIILYLSLPAKGNIDTSNIIIAFRNDDISVSSDLNFESQLLYIFRKHHIVPLYAVIPSVNGTELQDHTPVVDSLKIWNKKGWIDIAMHGYAHEQKFSELNAQNQDLMISKGIKLFQNLVGIDMQFFCPPWNASNRNTLKALVNNDVPVYSGYLGEKPVRNIKFINCNCNLLDGPLGDFSDFVEMAEVVKNENLIIPLLHSSYDFEKILLVQLDSLLDKITSNKRIKIVTFSNLMQDNQYSGLLNNANKAGYILKTIQSNKIFRKILLKIPLIDNLLEKQFLKIQQEYRRGEYENVSEIWLRLKLLIFSILIFLTISLALFVLSLRKRFV